jgi:phage terminase large subunit-like protein
MRLLMSMVDGESVRLTRGKTYDNAANLPPLLLDQLRRRYEGTRIGRQELEGELLEDVEGALWTYDIATRNRQNRPDSFDRIVVAVDPASTAKESSNETGIMVAGRVGDHAFVLEDLSVRASPLEWAGKVVDAYHRWKADAIVVETNQGGDMIATTLRTVDPSVRIKEVHATRGKVLRAEPVVALYEQTRVAHCGVFRELEDQMCSWIPTQESPDRLDALVWALTDLMLGHRQVPVVSPASLEQTSHWRI